MCLLLSGAQSHFWVLLRVSLSPFTFHLAQLKKRNYTKKNIEKHWEWALVFDIRGTFSNRTACGDQYKPLEPRSVVKKSLEMESVLTTKIYNVYIEKMEQENGAKTGPYYKTHIFFNDGTFGCSLTHRTYLKQNYAFCRDDFLCMAVRSVAGFRVQYAACKL